MEVRHPHVPELQSIRGLAALAVLLHHCSFLFVTSSTFHFFAEALFNAHAAVVIFFVLSGYVLVRSLHTKKINIESCARFYLARLFRIYPALWAVCAIAAGYLLLLHFRAPTPMASPWFAQYFKGVPTAGDIVKNMSAGGSLLIPPTWSVRVELVASAMIPFLSFAIRRGLGLWLLAGSTTMALAMAITGGHASAILLYLPSFIVGAMAFRYQNSWGRMYGKPWLLTLSTIVLIFFRQVNPAWRFDVDYHAIVPTLVESLAAAVLITGVVANRSTLLSKSAAVRLGDISYSLYLVHFIVMSALAKLIGGIYIDQDLRAVLLMVGTLIVSWPLAGISYAYIEKPGIWLGRVAFDTVSGRVKIKSA